MSIDLRERQRPLKERYRQDPASAHLVHSVHSTPQLDEPMRSHITDGRHTWEIAAHAMAGGPDGEACSGDVLLAALAGCQEITVKMVAASMGVALEDLRVTVTGEMDFRGTMGIDRAVPVGYQRIVDKAEQYCVVRDTLARGVPVESRVIVDSAAPIPGG